MTLKDYQDGPDNIEDSIRIRTDQETWTFGLASVFLTILAAVILLHGFIQNSWPMMLISVLPAIASMYFLVWPGILKQRHNDISELSSALLQLRNLMADFDAIQREHNKARAAYERAREGMENAGHQIVEVITQVLGQIGQRADLQEQLKDLRQENAVLTEHVSEWHERIIDIIDFLDRTISLDGLDKEYLKAVSKVRSEIIRNLEGLGITEITPEPGDTCDEKLHMVLKGTIENEGIPPGSICVVDQTGFLCGRNVLRPAKVILTPELEPQDVGNQTTESNNVLLINGDKEERTEGS